MRIVYKRSLAFIGFLIVLIGCVGIGYLFYDRVIDPETQVVVSDELSINYLDGATVIQDGEYRFSVTNNGDNEVNYHIELTDISGYSSSVSYILTSSDANITSEEKNLSDADNLVMDNILINPMETQNFTLKVSHNTSTTFRINVEKVDDVEEYFYMTLLNQNEEGSATSLVGKEVSTTNEGLIEAVDDDGATYYFRGAVDNNYVSFAGLTWRIVRINGDGSVRMILDDTSDTLVNYHDDMEGYETFNLTSLSRSLTTFYENYLSNYDKSIANTKFCSESGKSDTTYNAYTRIVTNEIPTFNCLGERYISKIGLLTVDEVIYAGAMYGTDNTSYYLYNSEIDNYWWTSSLSNYNDSTFYPFLVSSSGAVEDDVSGSLYRGLRPVISLNRTTVVTGSGTIADPYVVS